HLLLIHCLVSHSSLSCTFTLGIFFFFQAEDGIRDFHVTGVQTCALPIYQKPLSSHLLIKVFDVSASYNLDFFSWHCFNITSKASDRKSGRVGKECRSRWSPYH